ncbi:PaaI family thioesterase [Natronomonas salsuginis]|uniref:PaaI family thioesterase n=1 Tax=Natronomonas salsuginis TaxID=2217661 RepID=A0A4U5JBL9_9EURY|nr:PaaI family thioesterase [Natronomonas salsuginis]TKR26244.1 PaaI family thioesterase [Natronomonas salsuginis]
MTDANEWFLENHDHLQDLGITLEEQREGYVRLSLPYDESLANPGTGVMQGGIVATLIDHGGGAAIRTTFENPRETTHATTELNVSYLRPATADLTAEATVVRSGRTRGVVRVDVTADTPKGVKEIAVGRVSLYLDRS